MTIGIQPVLYTRPCAEIQFMGANNKHWEHFVQPLKGVSKAGKWNVKWFPEQDVSPFSRANAELLIPPLLLPSPPMSFVTLFCLPSRTMRLSVSCTLRCTSPLPLSYSIDKHLIWSRITVLFSLPCSSIPFWAFKHKEPRTKGHERISRTCLMNFFLLGKNKIALKSIDKHNPTLS